MSVGWTCRVIGLRGDVELEQLDASGVEWFGEGPGGVAAGAVKTVMARCAGDGADLGWIEAVGKAIEREISIGMRRSMLLVKRGEGWMFHASRSSNRESIARHGLDWRRMIDAGIAGSTRAEWPGVFLCSDLESARWFAEMARPGPADIWRARVDGLWLEGDPGASGGGDDGWMIATEPISAEDVALHERDV